MDVFLGFLVLCGWPIAIVVRDEIRYQRFRRMGASEKLALKLTTDR